MSKYKVDIELGKIQLSLDKVKSINVGTVIDLNIPAGKSAKVFIDDKHIANAEIQVYEKNLAARIIKDYSDFFQKIEDEEKRHNEIRKHLCSNIALNRTEEAIENIDVNEIYERIANKQNFDFLGHVSNNLIADFIMTEHPQTIALILIHLEELRCSEILEMFPDDLRVEVLMRIAKFGDISPAIVKRVSAVLESKMENLKQFKLSLGGPKFTGSIVDRMSEKMSNSVISQIACLDQELSSSIYENMLTLKRISEFDKNDIAEILKTIDVYKLMLALKPNNDKVKEEFLDCMSEEAAEIFSNYYDSLGAVKTSDVLAARDNVINKVRDLIKLGVINL